MRNDKLNRKKIFGITKIINHFYESKSISNELYLRFIYYYFLSSKQLLDSFDFLHLKTTNNEEIENNIKTLKYVFENDKNLFSLLSTSLEDKNGYLLNLEDLHPFVIEKINNNGIENFDIVTFSELAFVEITNKFNFKNNKFNYNELFLEEDIKENLLDFLKDLNFNLISIVSEYKNSFDTNDKKDNMDSVYSEIFDYQILNIFSKINFVEINYIPSYLLDIYYDFSKFIGNKNENIMFNSKFNFSFSSSFFDKQRNFNFDKSLFLNEELFFLNFSASLNYSKYKFFQTLKEINNIGFENDYDSIILNSLNSGQIDLDPEDKKIFEESFKDVKFSKKIEYIYYLIFNSLLKINDNGFIFVLSSKTAINKAGMKKYRKWLVENNYLYGVVDLPRGLFENGPSSTSIIILKKPNNNYDNNSQNSIMINAHLDYKKNDKFRYMDRVHTINLAKNLQTKKEYENSSIVVNLSNFIKHDYTFETNDYITFKNTAKSELSVKKMLKEVRKEKTIVDTLENKLEE